MLQAVVTVNFAKGNTFISPYDMFFNVRMVLMFVGFGHLACRDVMGKTRRVTEIVSRAAFIVALTCSGMP